MSGVAGPVLGIAGAVVGSFFGQPGVGFAIGSALGGVLFPAPTQQLPTVYGPRLGDLKVQTSTFGGMIPMVFGRMRIAGNVIWATDIVEHAHTTTSRSSGGKGGGGGGQEQSQTTYTYTISAAIAMCEGPILGVRRVWANSKLIYNVADSASSETVLSSTANQFTIYTGTETQDPDPLMESVEGTGEVPAYRGTAYFVLQDFLLTDFGNRIPNFEFEVATAGSIIPEVWTARVSAADIQWRAVCWSSPLMLFVASANTGTGNRIMTSPNGVDWTSRTSSGDYSWVGMIWSSIAGRFVGVAISSTNATTSTNGVNWTNHSTGSATSFNALCDAASLGFIIAVGGGVATSPNGSTWTDRFVPGDGTQWNSVAWSPTLAIAVAVGSGPRKIAYSTDGINWTTATPPVGGVSVWTGVAWSPELGLFAAVSNDGVVAANRVMTSPDGVNWTSQTAAAIASWNGIVWSPSAAKFMVVSDSISAMESTDGVLWTSVSASASRQWKAVTWSPELQMFVAVAQTGTGDRAMSYQDYSAVSADAVDLGNDIVLPLCLLSGLEASEIDVTDLVGTEVKGYVVSSRGPIRGMLEPLSSAFFFDAVESENTVKFVARGASSLVTIAESDLAARESNSEMPDAVVINRTQEVSLPVEVTISYVSTDNAYQVAQQSVRRLVTSAEQTITVQLPVALSDTEAHQIAEKTMYSMWSRREQLEFSTSRKYSKYEPTDVITVTKGGVELQCMITNRDEGANGQIRWQGVTEDVSVYTPSSMVGVSAPAPNDAVGFVGQTDGIYMDIPLLRDADDNAGFYFGAKEITSGWHGTWLYQSRDAGVNYSALENGSILDACTAGYASTALGSRTLGTHDVFDEGNTVTLVSNNALTSITRDEALNDPSLNVIWLAGEIIQFLTAELVDTDTYTISRLLRGRLGSESFMGTHVAGDVFCLLDAGIRSIRQEFYDLNQSYIYKALSNGYTLADTTPESFTNTGVRVKPLAGVQLGGGRDSSGDLYLEWIPRTRYTAYWLDSVNAPIGETTEEYEVVIMNGSTEVRSITCTSPAATYTAAMLASDFGSPTPASITVNIYQISQEAGRGYVLTGTF